MRLKLWAHKLYEEWVTLAHGPCGCYKKPCLPWLAPSHEILMPTACSTGGQVYLMLLADEPWFRAGDYVEYCSNRPLCLMPVGGTDSSLMICHLQIQIEWKYHFGINTNYNKMIVMEFCIYHERCADLPCAKLRDDLMTKQRATAKCNFLEN